MCCLSIDVVSGVLHGSVLGPLFFYCTLLTFQGYFRMCWLVMLTTLPCFVLYHILLIGHLWQHRWMMIWLWSAIGAVGGVCWWIQARRGGWLFLYLGRLSSCFLICLLMLYCCWNSLRVKDFGCYSRLKVSLREACQSNSCFCLKECWYFVDDNECFSRCRCYCQMLLGFGHSYSLCLSTVLQFGCLQPLSTCRCLIVLLAKLAN